jgi:hypothetical protein
VNPYVSVLLIWYWGANEPEVITTAGAEADHCASSTSYDVAPLVLSWSPSDGFGAKSQVSATVQHSFRCD